jgi:L-seryl-tRNA(Ser) seleniumtransferase
LQFVADIIAETATGAKPQMADFRVIPSIEQLRQRAGVRALEARYGRAAVVGALRAEADALRDRLKAGDARDAARSDAAAAIEQGLAARLADELAPSLSLVINATGVVIHTNLGRAPLAGRAAASAAAVGSGYANLEYDLATGRRGARDSHAERLIQRLTGAEAGIVVNNNAAAALLTLAALARGREVIVSRGELVEIGGGFRVPDVMAQSGAILREVGTTNRTRATDYAAAISERTALLLRVHPSNFRIEGFTERPSLEDLTAIARRFDIPLAEDLGSGYLGLAAGAPAIGDEPEVAASLAAGADVVFFSGDKLLGGPQAGIIAGRRDLISVVRRHPLMRALRVDKLTYAALEATLVEYATRRAAETVPVMRMIAASRDEIEARAAALAPILRAAGFTVELVEGFSTIGGGSAPGSNLPTVLVAISRPGASADALEAQLRLLPTPVVARIENDRVVLDLRTVLENQDALLRDAEFWVA